MSRPPKMRVPSAVTAEERQTYSSAMGRMYLHNLARLCSPELAARMGPILAEECGRLRDELDAARSELAGVQAKVDAVRELCDDDVSEQDAITEHHAGNEGPMLAHRIQAVLRDGTHDQAVGRNFPGAQPLPLRAEAIAENHPELTCQRCGGPNLLGWSAPNEVWNVGVPGRDGILCPQCFALAYEHATGTEPCWDLRPHLAALGDVAGRDTDTEKGTA